MKTSKNTSEIKKKDKFISSNIYASIKNYADKCRLSFNTILSL